MTPTGCLLHETKHLLTTGQWSEVTIYLPFLPSIHTRRPRVSNASDAPIPPDRPTRCGDLRVGDRLRPALGVEFFEHLLYVLVYRRDGHTEARRNLAIGATSPKLGEHLPLAPGQALRG